MHCPFCSYEETKVIDSRPADDNKRIRRRRECLSCAKRFTTYEAIETMPLMVVKKDKSRQPFDREKILKGLLRACEKRPVTSETLMKVVDEIENHFSSKLTSEIDSKEIGEFIIDRLRLIDLVAYVRFASVYKDFNDLESFLAELKNLRKEK